MHPRALVILEDAVRRARAPGMGAYQVLRIAELAVDLIFSDDEPGREEHQLEIETISSIWTDPKQKMEDDEVIEMVMGEFSAIGLRVGADNQRKRFLGGSGIFVVHGHETSVRDLVVDAVRKLGLKPVVIADIPGSSQTIIELIEQYSDVSYAVCLMTADDEGGAINGPQSKRARQNVIFEIGYFFALLGRSSVLVISQPNVEIPSNISGVRRVEITSGFDVEAQLRQELYLAGVLPRDLNEGE